MACDSASENAKGPLYVSVQGLFELPTPPKLASKFRLESTPALSLRLNPFFLNEILLFTDAKILRVPVFTPEAILCLKKRDGRQEVNNSPVQTCTKQVVKTYLLSLMTSFTLFSVFFVLQSPLCFLLHSMKEK